ncbi:MAG: nuclear transport factor 2 family protein [bacterium]
MTKQSTEVTIDMLQAFADAWNRHDVDDLMLFMTDDCVFESSAGDEVCGARYEGAVAVRKGYAKAWKDFPDAKWSDASHFIDGNRGVSEWIFSGTHADGRRVEVAGCDIFTFRDGKILIKNSYRKNRPTI